MNALKMHIQRQQDIACNLQGLIEALRVLDDEKVAPNAVTSLIRTALALAGDLNRNLDVVALPETAT